MSKFIGNIFLSTSKSRETITQLVSSAVNAKVNHPFSIESQALDVSIRRNPDVEERIKFPVIVELALQIGQEKNGKNEIKQILNTLRANGVNFETSVEEDELTA